MSDNSGGVAIIGMTGRFPGAANVDELWRNLAAGVESITRFTDEELAAAGIDLEAVKRDSNYVRARGILPNVDLFDAGFFKMNPREVEVTDPQHRLFLEAAWEALENAGYDPARTEAHIGVFAGVGTNTYYIKNLHQRPDVINAVGQQTVTIGNEKDSLATRIAYNFNLTGPALTISTACSSALVAISQAYVSLLTHQSDMALAGGVSVIFPQVQCGYYQEKGITSPDGRSRVFDVNARGTVFSDGVGIVVLKRLEDALEDGDQIHAVIKGTGINNDGSAKVGFTAPSVDGQAEAIALALNEAGFDPSTISYIECHGTATPIGDPIEITALTKAFRLSTTRRNFCAVGSVKSNFGHLGAAAGVTGLIKTALALKHKTLPASLNFERPNPQIDFANSPFYVNVQRQEWKGGLTPRRAGVSSFGFGGTNAHIILEEAPEQAASGSSRSQQLLLLSARSEKALEAATTNLVEYLKANPGVNLADVAYTLAVGRGEFEHRRAVVCSNVLEAIQALESRDSKRVMDGRKEGVMAEAAKVVFLFPGQGAQRPRMGGELYRSERVFREEMDRCAEILKPRLGVDLRNILYPASGEEAKAAELLGETRITQPAIFAVEYALARLWQSWGIEPAGMVGHSLGEIAAACVAGVFTLEDALTFVARRAELVQAQPRGAMVAVRLPEQELKGSLGRDISIAAVNAPGLCVVAGPFAAVESLEATMKERGVATKRLETSHAFHSAMVEPAMEPLKNFLTGLKLEIPQIPFVSDVNGRWIEEGEARNAAYWVKHMREAVRYTDSVAEVYRRWGNMVLVEVGPGPALSILAKQHPVRGTGHKVVPTLGGEEKGELAGTLRALGQLWLEGNQINWKGYYEGEYRRRLALPTYPFERKRYWVEAGKLDSVTPTLTASHSKKPDMADWFYVPSWKRSALASEISANTPPQNWLLFIDDLGVGEKIAASLAQKGNQITRVVPGEGFVRKAADAYVIRPDELGDYESLISELLTDNRAPHKIVHLWSLSGTGNETKNPASFERSQSLGLHSLIFLARALGNQSILQQPGIDVISDQIQSVSGDETLCAEKATVLGACKVLPMEYPKIHCRHIDAVVSRTNAANDQRLIGQLLNEIQANPVESIVAYRGGHRWVEIYEPIRLKSPADLAPLLKKHGVYLITGGLGGIGLSLAEFLATKAQAKIVLVGRSALPPMEEWPSWLASHDLEDETSQQIKKIESLKKSGAEVLVLTADVADEERMREVISLTISKFGRINGVIHAAGVIDRGGIIQRRTKEATNQALSAKARGAIVLTKLLADIKPDFLMTCSSIGAVDVGGMHGQVGYVAANEFLNALAFQNGACNFPVLTINWDAWGETGMAVKAIKDQINSNRTPTRVLTAENSLSVAEGINVFNCILSHGLSRVIVSVVDLETRKKLSQAKGGQIGSKRELEIKGAQPIAHERPKLNTAFAAPANDLEKTLSKIWQELLGFQEIGADDNFFDLQGDSLLLMQLQIKIRQKLGMELTSAEMFQYPTIASQARRLGNPSSEAEKTELILDSVQDRARMQRSAMARRPQPFNINPE